MDEEVRNEKEGSQWEKEKREKEEKDREKTRKNREKREKIKKRKQGGKAVGGDQAAVGSGIKPRAIERTDEGNVEKSEEGRDVQQVGVIIHDDD